jgi:hydrogenase-4 component E
MSGPIPILIVLLLLINLHLLGSSRIDALIRGVSLQALLLIGLAAAAQGGHLPWHGWLFAGITGLVKGFLLPAMMRRALRVAGIQKEVEPLVGYPLSLFLGLLCMGGAIWGADRLPLPVAVDPLVAATAFSTISVGLFLIVARSKAITQTLGYLSMENGIYALGLALAVDSPLIVEMGILLDVFVGIFVMGVVTLHIQREFRHIDVDRLSELKD